MLSQAVLTRRNERMNYPIETQLFREQSESTCCNHFQKSDLHMRCHLFFAFLISVVSSSWAADFAQNIQKSHQSGRNEYQYFSDMDASFYAKWHLVLPAIDEYRSSNPLRTIYDVGTGTGLLAATLANHFKSESVTVKVVGTDVMPEYVARATKEHVRPDLSNLTFRVRSTDQPCMDIDSEPLADILIFSSVLHEAYSYGDDGDSVDSLKRALYNAHKSLAPKGRVIIRDFVAPDKSTNHQTIILHHRQADIKTTSIRGAVREMSCSNFANDFRAINNKGQSTRNDIRCKEIDNCADGYRCYETNITTAYEFMYRKDFNDSYEAELNERYGFTSARDARLLLEDAGFTVLQFNTFRSEWIHAHRINDNIALFTQSNERVAIPDYQMFIVAEKGEQ
jgi:SAM-dependent methyltransferase